MFTAIRADLAAILSRDPAARSAFSAVFLYPSFHVMCFYRIAHRLWRWRLTFIARFLMQFARWFTGIEIHPGARIGPGFFADHGMGVVIGETSVIGENVTLYHGVTLGGTSPAEHAQSQRGTKRHPTIGDCVIIGAGAQVLGPVTVHRCARVGGNSVVTRDVPEGVTVAGVPARPISKRLSGEEFDAYAVAHMGGRDPQDKAMEGLAREVQQLRSRLAELEAQAGEDTALGMETSETTSPASRAK